MIRSGVEFGTGSSRDSAAKGTDLLGIRMQQLLDAASQPSLRRTFEDRAPAPAEAPETEADTAQTGAEAPEADAEPWELEEPPGASSPVAELDLGDEVEPAQEQSGADTSEEDPGNDDPKDSDGQ